MVSAAAQLCGICIDQLWNFLLHRWRDCQEGQRIARPINVKTADAPSLTVPGTLVATADE
jgi:hypothetical protein